MLAPARLIGIGTALPPVSYTQDELLRTFGITDPATRAIFLNSTIQRRGLTLPPQLPDRSRAVESQGELLDKHLTQGLRLGRRPYSPVSRRPEPR